MYGAFFVKGSNLAPAFAALLKSYKPSLTVAQLKWYLKSGASTSYFREVSDASRSPTAIFGHGIAMPGESLELITKPAPLQYNKPYFINNHFPDWNKGGYLSLNGKSTCQNADYCLSTKDHIIDSGGLWTIIPASPRNGGDNFVRGGDPIKIYSVSAEGKKVYLNVTGGDCPKDYHCVSRSFNQDLGGLTWGLTRTRMNPLDDPMRIDDWATFHPSDPDTDVMTVDGTADGKCTDSLHCVFTSRLFNGPGGWFWRFSVTISPIPPATISTCAVMRSAGCGCPGSEIKGGLRYSAQSAQRAECFHFSNPPGMRRSHHRPEFPHSAYCRDSTPY